MKCSKPGYFFSKYPFDMHIESLSNIVLEACLFSRCFFVPPALSSHPLTAVMPSKPLKATYNAPSDICLCEVRRVKCLDIASAPLPLCARASSMEWNGMEQVMEHSKLYGVNHAWHQGHPCLYFTYGKKNTLSLLCHWLLELSPSSRKCRCTCQWQQVFSEATHFLQTSANSIIAQAILKLEIYWNWKAYVKKKSTELSAV